MSSVPEGMPTLSAGVHSEGGGRACVMEYVALLAGEDWTDAPRCTNPFLADITRCTNDTLRDEDRSLLVPLIGRLFGTGGNDQTDALALWWNSEVVFTNRSMWDPTEPAALVANLSGLLDEYDRLTGRTEHREVSDTELSELAARVVSA